MNGNSNHMTVEINRKKLIKSRLKNINSGMLKIETFFLFFFFFDTVKINRRIERNMIMIFFGFFLKEKQIFHRK
jgi:hypothetical protein